ncbi:DUF4234 domain-containing protein [Methanobrevibacter filiformis]|uniref:Uncharacterized protein n=1 Tax=Methanobrevibacter filiformis TaxID=55758 RepID=A0A166BKL6_9EURY|nr:DUF4234 domain-containing protein [Methanobrevibacter filiformis]KZX13491.1 hypothetical protein MBFIL_10130 [Methanobrevibacter filiformis]
MINNNKYCSHCGKVIPYDAKRCMYCDSYVGNVNNPCNQAQIINDHELNKHYKQNNYNSPNNPQQQMKHTSMTHSNYHRVEYSKVLPLSKYFLLMVLTCGLYNIYWFYKNLKYIKNYHDEDISVGLRTFCFCFVPIAGLLVFYEFLDDMNHYAKSKGLETYSSGLQLLGIILSNFFVLIPLYPWFFMNIQETINEYWRLEEPNLPIKRSFSSGEFIVLIVGGIITLIFYYMFFIAAMGALQNM